MRRKKVAVFTTVWNADYLYALLQGMKQEARKRKIDLYLFNTYGDSDPEYEVFTKGEYNIFFLPDLKEFDGVLIASNNVGTERWVNSLLERVRQANIPCVGAEQENGLEYYIGADNYHAMYAMVEHLVRDKGCRVLNYVGGPSDNQENCQRKQAFLDVLKKYNLPCDPKRMKDYSFRWEDGMLAYRHFRSIGMEKTDAVVCANDYMAIGYLKGASEDGLNAPDDFLITGFDNIKEAQRYSPQLTSVDRTREPLGIESIRFLDDLMENRPCPKEVYVPFRQVYAQSTGDAEDYLSEREFRRKLFETTAADQVTRLHLKHLRTSLLGNESAEDFVSILCRYAPSMGIGRFFMGLDANKIVEDAGSEKIFFGCYDGNVIRLRGEEATGLVPSAFLVDDDDVHTYLFSPCHCSGMDYGYCVIVDNFEIVRQNVLSEWMLAVDNAVEALRQSLHLQIMNKKLNELYRRDSLTNLYNRFALRDKGDLLMRFNREMGKSTLIIFADMDSLKRANDEYGHDMGDIALKTIADAVNGYCVGEFDFTVRYGGDEFLLLGTFHGMEETEKMIESMEESITVLAKTRGIPFVLTASIGYAEVRPDASDELEYYIRCADHHMYEKKLARKKAAAN